MTVAPQEERQSLLRHGHWKDGDDEQLQEGTDEQEQLPTVLQELKTQAKMAVPLAVGHVTNYLLTVVSLAYVGHLGTRELAAASLAYTLYNLVARIVLAGLLGGLDTFASQAVGAGKLEVLGSMFWQAVLFLMLHTLPLAAVFASTPALLARLGQSPEIIRLLRPYLLALLPGVWVDAVYRPLNRIMIAQRITQPTMWVSIIAAAQHVPTTHLFVAKWDYLGAAYASVWSSLLALLLAGVYVRMLNLHPRVWGTPEGLRLQPWRPYIKLSYAACVMVAIMMMSTSFATLAAGWLPNPEEALATTAVAISLYGIIQMTFGALTQTTCIRVGHGLGAASAARAALSVRAAASVVPFLWALVASILVVPKSQRALIGLFSSNPSEALLNHLHFILRLLAGQMLLDLSSSVLSGVISGAGKQLLGFLIVALAHWGCALPTALLLAFKARWGVGGLYCGMALAPVVLLASYGTFIWRTRWDEEAERAHKRMLAAHTQAAAARHGRADGEEGPGAPV